MANDEHMRLLRQGSSQWNEWRKNNPQVRLNLSGASLSGAKLIGADLSGANLIRANLTTTNLSKASLIGANLIGANLSETDLSKTNLYRANLSKANLKEASLYRADLSEANLSETDLSEASLSETNLSGASLIRANLSGAKLIGADLSGATLGSTIIAKMNLHATQGLAAIRHIGRSYIDLTSVQLPQDGSALHFLRGVGIPDEWIDFYRASSMHPIQYHSCFISYSSKDDLLAKRLHADLQDKGVRCWFAPEDMKIGDTIRQRIDEAIHVHEKLLLLLSEHSIASTWVRDEVEAAFEKEQRQQRGVLFPVRLDSAVMQTTQAWAATLRRTRHIGDFSTWSDPQAYQKAFERLMRDLKQE